MRGHETHAYYSLFPIAVSAFIPFESLRNVGRAGFFSGHVKRVLWMCMVIVCCLPENHQALAQFPRPFSGIAPPISGEIMRESNIVPINSAMFGNILPSIPNLKFGFQYFFGGGSQIGNYNIDYLHPVNLGPEEVIFGEVHGNYWDYGKTPRGNPDYGADLSFGGGYRRIVSNSVLAGVNGFYDTVMGYNKWYQSGSVGFEMAANIGASNAIDFNANWYYGNLFSSTEIANLFRKDGNNYDFMAGYSMSLLDSALDLRLKAALYNFDVGNNVYGYMTGADLTTRNGVLTFTYEYGDNWINGAWNNFGVFVNLGFLLSNYIMGDNPFTLPEPVTRNGQRNLSRMMSSGVSRTASSVVPPPIPTPTPTPPSSASSFALANSVVWTPGSDGVSCFPFDGVLDFNKSYSMNNATITVANPPPTNPVLITLYNQQGVNSPRNLWLVMGSQTISQTDFPDWFSGGPWKGIAIVNNTNTDWVPVSFTINYGTPAPN